MTPFSRFIMDQALNNRRDARLKHIAEGLYEAHFFEVTRFMDHVKETQKKFESKTWAYCRFSPAPVTWIEWDCTKLAEYKGQPNLATGILLFEYTEKYTDMPDLEKGFVFWTFHKVRDEDTGVEYLSLPGEYDESTAKRIMFYKNGRINSDLDEWCLLVLTTLAAINRPREFGQKQFEGHKGYARKVTRSGLMPGRFPLRGWTEIHLPIQPPEDKSSHPPVETGLTWNNPLHFVRKHLRRGKEVEAFWRGDPALGIKRSRYVLVNKIEPPKHLLDKVPQHLRG